MEISSCNAEGLPEKKRSSNTSLEQLELYLHVVEEDSVFRTGIINPKLDADYMKTKWNELTVMLNSLGSGAILTSSMWKKRFSDWKNFVRHKARTIAENRKKTGGGPEVKYALTDLEERALMLFGKIVVTGSSGVTAAGGLQRTIESSSIVQTVEPIITIPEEQDDSEILTFVVTDENSEMLSPNSLPHATPTTDTVTEYKSKKGSKTNMSEIGHQLVQSLENGNKPLQEIANKIEKYTEVLEKVQTAAINVEKLKLRFEIEKYKFENPTFDFKFED